MTAGQRPDIIRIAMWSGPRNISTAMMRAWENRADTIVWDEPLYGYYLQRSGADHPMAAEILSNNECDIAPLIARLTGMPDDACEIFYQKHMTHHLLADTPRHWFGALQHCFLIRRPEAVLASYAAKREAASFEELGYGQQSQLFDEICQLNGEPPPVIESDAFLSAPEAHLRAICKFFAIAFDPAMLRWPPGPRASDGIWAPHWYDSVWKSQGFGPPRTDIAPLPAWLAKLAEQCRAHYQKLHAYRLIVS